VFWTTPNSTPLPVLPGWPKFGRFPQIKGLGAELHPGSLLDLDFFSIDTSTDLRSGPVSTLRPVLPNVFSGFKANAAGVEPQGRILIGDAHF